MPRAPKPCGINGCRTIVPNGQRCPEHANGWKNSPQTASSTLTGHRRWKELRAFILDRDRHTCQIRTPGVCIGRATVVDKIIPAARRPELAYIPSNLRAACRPCNDHKAHTTDRRT